MDCIKVFSFILWIWRDVISTFDSIDWNLHPIKGIGFLCYCKNHFSFNGWVVSSIIGACDSFFFNCCKKISFFIHLWWPKIKERFFNFFFLKILFWFKKKDSFEIHGSIITLIWLKIRAASHDFLEANHIWFWSLRI